MIANRNLLLALLAVAVGLLVLAFVLWREAPDAPATAGQEQPATTSSPASDPVPVDAPVDELVGAEISPAVPSPASALYANDRGQLQAVIDRDGLDDPDTLMAALMVMALCNDPRLQDDGSIDHVIGRGVAGGSAVGDELHGRYCGQPLALPDGRDSLATEEALMAMLARSPSLAELHVFLESRAGGELSQEDGQLLRSMVAEAVIDSERLTDLLLLAGRVESGAGLDGMMETLGVGNEMHEGALGAGVTLAACRFFPGCEDGSLLASLHCAGGCAHPAAVPEQLRSRLPPEALAQAERIASALVVLRTRGLARRQSGP